MNIPLVDLQRQYRALKPKLDKAVLSTLQRSDFILGSDLENFENEFATYCGTKYCIGVASGTDAILLALKALGVSDGDEVITVANTFVSTVFPIISLGAKPILVDIDPSTYQINPSQIEKAITKKTKVILPVHLYGIPANMSKIMQIAKTHGLYVLEDACQAHGSAIKNKRCGSFGDLAAFSFYPGKNLGAGGDGGAVTTNNPSLAHLIRMVRNVGQSKKYQHDVIGYNSRLDTIQAAVLRVKLNKLDQWNRTRNDLAKLYSKLLVDLPVVLPPLSEKDFLVNFHLYVIRTDRRNQLMDFLSRNGVSTGIHYPTPIHLQKSLGVLKYKQGDFPVSERYSQEILSLPIFPYMNKQEVRKICSLIKQFFKTV